MEEAIAAVVVGVLTILGGVYVAWWTGTTHFYRQRWWERKAQAYVELVAAVTETYNIDLKLLREVRAESLMTESNRAALRANRRDVTEKMSLIGWTAGFLVSDEAAVAVMQFSDAQERLIDADPVREAEKRLDATKTCLHTVVALAKEDLKIPA